MSYSLFLAKGWVEGGWHTRTWSTQYILFFEQKLQNPFHRDWFEPFQEAINID